MWVFKIYINKWFSQMNRKCQIQADHKFVFNCEQSLFWSNWFRMQKKKDCVSQENHKKAWKFSNFKNVINNFFLTSLILKRIFLFFIIFISFIKLLESFSSNFQIHIKNFSHAQKIFITVCIFSNFWSKQKSSLARTSENNMMSE